MDSGQVNLTDRVLEAPEAHGFLIKVRDNFQSLLLALHASERRKKESCPKAVFDGVCQIQASSNPSRGLVSKVLCRSSHLRLCAKLLT